jgi:DNA-binding NtrC family response regulator
VLSLAQHFLDLFAQGSKADRRFSAEVTGILTDYSWPGNVRELRNALERAAIFAEPHKPIRVAHLPPSLRPDYTVRETASTNGTLRSLREVENDHIQLVLAACQGNRASAAEILGISPVTLWRKLNKKDTDPDE